MCGINGIYNFSKEQVLREQLEEMNSRMVHRGPDDEGYFLQGNIGLAMRRLSIIDLEGGHQPILNEDGTLAVVLNGEIYNYIEIREMLIAKGHTFRTGSDTEVIVHLFEEEGPACVERLNGMFAFAVWDSRKKELFVCRDRIGIKPLYYKAGPGSFVFSSDLSSLISVSGESDIDLGSFLSYLGLSYVPSPRTIFEGAAKLAPGHYLTVSETGMVTTNKYWEINEFGTLELSSTREYEEEMMALLRDSMRLQMRSDVPVGTFLSGGIDSSSVVALLSEQVDQPVRTFSVGFEGGLNELPYAKLVSERFGTDHTELLIHEKDIPAVLPEIIEKMDEPLSDNALVPTMLLSRLAVDNGVKVILNGTGGDEIFGGYHRYLPQNRLWQAVHSLPSGIRKVSGNLLGLVDHHRGMKVAHSELSFMASISGVNYSFTREMFKDRSHHNRMLETLFALYRDSVPSGSSKVHHLMHFDLKEYLVGDILSLLDKMTMAVSLEGRVPLLDHRLVEMCFRIPDSIRFSGGKLKGLAKSALRDMLPNEIMNLPKAGFAGPTAVWVGSTLKSSIYSHLIDEPIDFFRELLDRQVIKRALDNIERDWRYSESIFSLYIFSLWYRRHIQGREVSV